MTPDTEHFWKGLEEKKLLIQKCSDCGALRHPPEPMCPHCNSLEWETIESAGRGKVYSFAVMHHPSLPAFDSPNPVVLIELDEGVRIVSNIVGIASDQVSIGMPVEVEFVRTDPELMLHQFKPVEA